MESFCLLLLAVTQASSKTGTFQKELLNNRLYSLEDITTYRSHIAKKAFFSNPNRKDGRHSGDDVLEKRIIGGKECVANSQHVSLFYFDDYICGGTLISKHWVLTAAHCLKPNILMQLGEHNLEVNEGNEQFAHTAIFCPHPKYDSVIYDNDIMLLKLNAPAKLNKYVQTISIGCPEVSSGTECTIAGWGSTTSIVETYPNILHCGTVTTETQDECQRLHSDLKITDNMLCASIAGETMDTCYGDSGGSLVCNSVVHGVTSFGHTTCGTGTKPGVYTKVCKYRDWIRKTVAKGDCL